MKRSGQAVIFLTALAVLTTAAETETRSRSESDWKIVDEALRTPMLAMHAWYNGKHEEAVRLLIAPEELAQLEKAHYSAQDIARLLKDRKGTRLDKLLNMSRRLRNSAQLSADKTTVFFPQTYCPVKYTKHGDKWYVIEFEQTFHVATPIKDLPSDDAVLAATQEFIRTGLRLLNEGRFRELAIHTGLPHDLQVATYGEMTEDFVMDQKKQERLRSVLSAMQRTAPTISWDKESLVYDIAGDDYGIVRYGMKWCLVH